MTMEFTPSIHEFLREFRIRVASELWSLGRSGRGVKTDLVAKDVITMVTGASSRHPEVTAFQHTRIFSCPVPPGTPSVGQM